MPGADRKSPEEGEGEVPDTARMGQGVQVADSRQGRLRGSPEEVVEHQEHSLAAVAVRMGHLALEEAAASV